MSAYIVGKDHILYLLAAMVSRRICPHGFYWFHGGRTTEPLAADMDKAAELANALWLENIRSVSARYPGESSGTLPGPGCGSYVILATDFSRNRWQEMDPVQVLKAIDAYAYQSCEHDGWESSEAHAICEALRHRAIQALPGYEEAEWGAPAVRKPGRGLA